jgi:ABC-2 type transport system ATP-binding protein
VPQRLAVPEHATCGELGRLVAALRGLPRDAVRTALADVGLADRWEARVRDLSGGQRQRLSLALADAGRPRALVLDEPSISLDADGAETVCRAVRAAQTRGAAVLFASHHLHEVAALADRVVLLGRGSVVAERAGALLRDPGAFAAFYRLAACEVADAA